jgi:hypothetical protein
LVGGSEAPLTDFTIAQMRALKIYSPAKRHILIARFKQNKKYDIWCREEVFTLENGKKNALAFPANRRRDEHNISISANRFQNR